MDTRAKDRDLEPGVDYVVKDGADDWLSFSDDAGSRHFRHTWVLQRRRRPKAPSFAGAPLPRHRPGENQRAAAIVMSYFHPWTLRSSDACENVPFAGNLRSSTETWQEAMESWLDGRILTQESKKYIGNFLSVHRVRPMDDDESDGNSDDIVSDEELQVSAASLKEALSARIGGKDTANKNADVDDAGNVTSHTRIQNLR